MALSVRNVDVIRLLSRSLVCARDKCVDAEEHRTVQMLPDRLTAHPFMHKLFISRRRSRTVRSELRKKSIGLRPVLRIDLARDSLLAAPRELRKRIHRVRTHRIQLERPPRANSSI